MARRKSGGHLAPKLIAVAVASCFAYPPAWGNPTGAQVVNGTAGFARPNASTLKVTNSPGAIINWQGFSIGAGEITRFVQQSASSAVLNRVVGADISSIQGQLLSNGRVFLINPAGIVVGPGAVVDTAGFVGSTLNMQNADFLAGKLKFEGDAQSGRIVNQGWIKTAQGGQVMLIAPQIENGGLIHTPKGELILAAGRKLTISSLDHEGVQFEVQAPTDTAMNVGKLLAEGGAIGVFAGTLRHSGEIRATSLAVDATGQVVLKAQKDIDIAAGSITSASGVVGGKVQVQSGDTTLVAGSIEARGSDGKGGTIHILGDKAGLLDQARVDASGKTGGGTVLVGGDFQGKNPAIQNAFRTYVAPDALIKADAIANGDGGKVIVWSDDATRFYGNISARAGAAGGNGGFAEVSGKNYLDYKGRADLGSPAGATGVLFLDPNDVEIRTDMASGGGAFGGGDPNIFGGGATTSQILWNMIKTNLATADVYITTSGGGVATGNINVVHNSPDLATSRNLRLLAHNNIFLNGSITNTGSGALDLYAGWNEASGTTTPAVITGTGQIVLFAPITYAGNVFLHAGEAITQNNASASITANNLMATALAGEVDLSVATNSVTTLAGSATSAFMFVNDKSLVIGSVTDTAGVTVNGVTVDSGAGFGGAAEVSITAAGASSDLTVNRNVTALSSGSTANAIISLTAGRHLTVNNRTLTATAANAADIGGAATITLTATGGNLTLNSSTVTATGGDASSAGAASVTLKADAGSIMVNNSTISAAGGNAGTTGCACGGGATVTLQADAGNITVGSVSTLVATGGGGEDSGGAATVTLKADAGGITVDSSSITATGGLAAIVTGGAATVQLLAQTSLDVSSSTILANGGTGFDGASATVELQGLTGGISINGGSVGATGGNGSSGEGSFALVTLTGAGITLNSPITATGGDGFSLTGGSATVTLTAPSGNISLGRSITATGGNDISGGAASIGITADEGAILQSSGVSELKVTSPATPGFREINLFGLNGIGTTGAPIRIAGGFDSVTASNTFTLTPNGNIVLSQTTGNVDLGLYTVTNTAAGGGVDIKAEALAGSIIVPAPGFSNPNGPITLRADSMDIQGPVNAASGTGSISVQTVTPEHLIDLGTALDLPSALGLSNLELGRLIGGSLTIGSIANAISVTAPVTFTQSLSIPGAVTIDGSGSLGIGGATNTVGSIAGPGGIALSGGALAVGSDNTSTNFLGVISGTGGLTKQGTGTLTLSGANAYTGATAVNEGTLAIGAAERIDNQSAVTVAGGATFDLAGFAETVGSIAGAGGITLGAGTLTTGGNNASTTYLGVMSGTGGLTKQGTGTLTLSGANAYTGATAVNEGTLAIGAAERIDNQSAVTVAGGAIFNLAGFAETAGSIAGAGGITLGSGTLTAGGNNASTTYSGVMSGAGGLTKQGTGTLTLSGTNTYDGATTVDAGVLRVANDGALGSSAAGTTVAAGAAVEISGSGLSIGESFTLNGSGVSNGGALRNLANTNMVTGPITLGSAARIGSVAGTLIASGDITNGGNRLTVTGAGDTTVSGAIGGAGGLTKAGAGTLNLSGANTYAGATTINAGTLAAFNGAAIGDSSAVVMKGGTLSLAADETVGSLAGTSNVALGANTLTTGGNNASTTYSGVMSGTTGGLTKQGTGTLTLSGTNSYDGTTLVNAGVLRVANDSGLGTAIGGTMVAAGAAVEISGSGLSIDESLTLNGSGVGSGGALRNLANANEVTGAIALGSAARISSDAGTLTLSGGVDNGGHLLTVGGAGDTLISTGVGGAGGLTKQSAGTLTLTGANAYTGATTVNAGTLELSSATLSGNLINHSTTTVNGSSVVSGGMQHSGTLHININSGGGSLAVGGAGFDWQGGTLAGGGSLAMSGGAPFKVTGAAAHTLNGPTIALASLDLTGGSLNLKAGTVKVSNTITVGSGTTLAAQGATIDAADATLDLSGTFQSGAGSVTVGSMNVLTGGLLKGTGTLNGDVNNSAGTVSPGLSPGILTINGNYVQGAHGTLNMEIGGTVPGASGHDQLVVSGTASLDGTLNASLINGFFPTATDSFALLKAGSVTGTFATTNLPAGTLLAPAYDVSSFVLSTPPSVITTPPPVPPIVVVETERQRRTLEEAPEQPGKETITSPICR